MTPAERHLHLKILVAFGLVYIFWGSTYLAIKVAVESIPPVAMAGARFLVAGPFMLAWCAWSGRRMRVTRDDLLKLLLIGVLLLTGGNVALAWSEQYLPSGFASLIVAVVPIWVAVIEGFILRKVRLSGQAWVGLALGLIGLAVLLWPRLQIETVAGRMEVIAAFVVLLGSLSWTLGSLASKYLSLNVGPFVATGWQMTLAGLVNTLIALPMGEFAEATWSPRSTAAVVYLIIFGSWVGFTAYIWLLEHVPTPKVATYAYVNPVVAVLLGWAVLNEVIDLYIAVGTVVIVAAVALVTSAKLKEHPRSKAEELPKAEVGGD